ncbi:MAG: hypothetical protein CMB11_01695 [Euryarchaeota archaeon]|nr:hypothetical protein [Euryarchaeota archaeon]
MSVRHGDDTIQSPAQQLRMDIATVRSTEATNEVTWEQLNEVEKSAASIGVAPDAWKPIGWLNEGHYGELLRNNALDGRLTQKIEAFKTVAGQ